MPTASERASAEGARWMELAGNWESTGFSPKLVLPTESAVVRTHDPTRDLDRRAKNWGHTFEHHELSDLAMFAAALANTEAEAWTSGSLDIATRAYEERRFLLGDRLIHWAVPWLTSIAWSVEVLRPKANEDRQFLLSLADEMRPAPALSGREGLVPDGEDSFGPLSQAPGNSLWSGWVEIEGQRPTPGRVDEIWTGLAKDHPGSARLWLDLATRGRVFNGSTVMRVHEEG